MATTHRRIGRRRATEERTVVMEAVGMLTDLLESHDVDREGFDEQASRKFDGLPERYREEFRGMVDALPISAADLRLYAFAIGDLTTSPTPILPQKAVRTSSSPASTLFGVTRSCAKTVTSRARGFAHRRS